MILAVMQSVCSNPRLRRLALAAMAGGSTVAGRASDDGVDGMSPISSSKGHKPSSRIGKHEDDPEPRWAGAGRGLQSWQIRMRDLRFGRSIGKGNVGEVYEGLYQGRQVAIKKLQASSFRHTDMVTRFRDEIYLLSTVTHPNVLVFVGAVLEHSAGNLCLVTELCRKGNLADYLASGTRIPWSGRIQMASDIARGMHYLHGRAGIIQRDLKSENLLLDDFRRVKIADFGLSRTIGSGVMDTYCGTPATMAPEIVLHEDYDERADVFSFAIIMWELLTRQRPYHGRSGVTLAMDVANKGARPPIPAYCPAEWAHIMTRAWARQPADRPGFDEILDTLLGMQRLCDEQIENAIGTSSSIPLGVARPSGGRDGTGAGIHPAAAAAVTGGHRTGRPQSTERSVPREPRGRDGAIAAAGDGSGGGERRGRRMPTVSTEDAAEGWHGADDTKNTAASRFGITYGAGAETGAAAAAVSRETTLRQSATQPQGVKLAYARGLSRSAQKDAALASRGRLAGAYQSASELRLRARMIEGQGSSRQSSRKRRTDKSPLPSTTPYQGVSMSDEHGMRLED